MLAGRDFPLGVPGFTYQDLHREERLADLDQVFRAELEEDDPSLAARLTLWRSGAESLDPIATSRFLVEAARPVARFVARLFGIEREWRAQADTAAPEAVLFRFRRDFLLRRAVRAKVAGGEVARIARESAAIESGLFGDLPWDSDPELATARLGTELLDLEAEHIEAVRQKKRPSVSEESRARVAELARRAAAAAPEVGLPVPRDLSDDSALEFLETLLARYAFWCKARLDDPELRRRVAGWVSFRLPGPVDFHHLVETERPEPSLSEVRVGPAHRRRRREGFGLTDPRMTRREVLGETHYCILCHEREKDSCSKGFFDEKTGTLQKNPLGIALPGCPLDEKISEMHQLRREGDSIGALALVVHRQPDVPGHGPPHLQRLHEGMHLPEAGPREHPADRDRRPDRRARAALGGRDLRPPHPLESAVAGPAATRSPTTAGTSSSSDSGPRATRSRTTS